MLLDFLPSSLHPSKLFTLARASDLEYFAIAPPHQ